MEKYLTILDDKKYRIIMTRFRTNNNRLPINSGRFNDIESTKRFCPLCDCDEIGDEFHYLFKCSFFTNDRTKYIKPCYTNLPNTLSMRKLMNSDNKEELVNLAKFMQIIMEQFNVDNRSQH